MKKIFTVLLALCSLTVAAQNKPAKKQGVFSGAQEKKKTVSFPESFVGHWKGKLNWYMAGKPAQEFDMQLIIKNISSDTAKVYTWQIIYGSNGQDNRPYLLKPVDTAKGHWIVDEGDSIVLDSYVLGNSFTGAFTVQGNTIVDNYRIVNGKMLVEFFSIRLGDKKTSGKGTEETPFVDSYRVGSYQVGELQRINK